MDEGTIEEGGELKPSLGTCEYSLTEAPYKFALLALTSTRTCGLSRSVGQGDRAIRSLVPNTRPDGADGNIGTETNRRTWVTRDERPEGNATGRPSVQVGETPDRHGRGWKKRRSRIGSGRALEQQPQSAPREDHRVRPNRTLDRKHVARLRQALQT